MYQVTQHHTPQNQGQVPEYKSKTIIITCCIQSSPSLDSNSTQQKTKMEGFFKELGTLMLKPT